MTDNSDPRSPQEQALDDLLAPFSLEMLQESLKRREGQQQKDGRQLLIKFCQEARSRGLDTRLSRQRFPVTATVTALVKISPSTQWQNHGSLLTLHADVKCCPHPEHASVETQIEQAVEKQTNAADLGYKQTWEELRTLAKEIGLNLEEICFPFEDFLHRLSHLGKA